MNFVICFTREKAPSSSNQVIVFLLPIFLSCAHFPGFDVSQSSLSQTAPLFLAPTAVFSAQKIVHSETHVRLSLCIPVQNQHWTWCELYCLHMTWNKMCSSAVLLYGERVVLGENYPGHFYIKYGLSLHLWWYPNWSFAESKKTSIYETLPVKQHWWENPVSAKKSSVTLLVAKLSKINALKEAEGSLTYLLLTTRTYLRYITGEMIYPTRHMGYKHRLQTSVSASSKPVRQVSVPRPLGHTGI